MADDDKDALGQTPLSGGATPGAGRANVNWDDSRMETAFANVVNIQGTREQVEMFFGTHSSWSAQGDGSIKVELTNRMILTPYAAKRLNTILTRVMREYEARHGILSVEDAG
eukprot:TRINITY_DN38780_c0_g1_i1.p3 TRINITY_DN38780_c0_g1~~TRINITY_DN38780_c0_g1_i1.p3  ORF type:complete len:112 (-),score=33.34 TRINITY_DN38780_c0_g1_i1:26-361(-)